jgi:O-antigen ligase
MALLRAQRDVKWLWVAPLVGALLVEPLLFVSAWNDVWVLPKITLLRAVFLVTCASYCVARAVGRAAPLRVPRPVLMAAVAMTVANLVSFSQSADLRLSTVGEYASYQGLLTVLLYVGYFVLVTGLPMSERQVRAMLTSLVAASALASSYAVLQKFNIDWLEWSGSDGRPFASFGQPDTLGIFLVQTIPLALLPVLGVGRARQALASICLGLMVAALVFTLSRSAWAGLGVSLVVGLGLGYRAKVWSFSIRRTHALLAAGVVVAAVVPLAVLLNTTQGGTVVGERVASSVRLGDISTGGRLALWHRGLEMFEDRPLWGWGQETFGVLFGRYRQPDDPHVGTANIRPISSHNMLIDVGLTTGALGLAAFASVVGLLYTAALKALKNGRARAERAMILAILASVSGYLAATMFNFGEVTTAWVFWILMALGLRLTLSSPAHGSTPSGSDTGHGKDESQSARRSPWGNARRRVPWAVAAVVALVGLVFVGFPPTAEVLAVRAQDAATDGRWEDAIRLQRRAVNVDPLQPYHLVQLGEILTAAAWQSEDTAAGLRAAAGAYHDFERRFAFDSYVEVSAAWVEAVLFVEHGADDVDVLTHLERALAADPWNAELRCAVAQIYAYVGEDEVAATLGTCR